MQVTSETSTVHLQYTSSCSADISSIVYCRSRSVYLWLAVSSLVHTFTLQRSVFKDIMLFLLVYQCSLESKEVSI